MTWGGLKKDMLNSSYDISFETSSSFFSYIRLKHVFDSVISCIMW